MPKFSFTAKSQQGEPHSGTKEARNESELAKAIREEGYVLISAELQEKPEKRRLEISIPFLGGISFKEKMMMTRNLQVMIGAGVSLPRALKTISTQSTNKELKKVLQNVAEEVTKGRSFANTLEKHPKVFSELFRSMVRVGEEAGTLEENLGVLNRQMEREYDLRSKIQSALMYPAVIILAMAGIGIMMLVTVVPKLAQTFEELEIELPLTTRLVIALGNFMANQWYLAIPLAAVFFFLFKVVLQTNIGKRLMGKAAIKIPIISSIIKKTNSAYTVRTLASLLAAGVSLIRSLEIISGSVGNFYYKQALSHAIEEIRKGGKLSAALAPYSNLFAPTVIQMLEVGEETGETSAILEKLGDFFEEEVATATKNMASIIEPVLMLFIGGAVGFFAISMIQPMYSMLSSIK